ncbi:hypothetical protein D9611_000752 [Ephemerocybe angulata]|uniref:Ribonuclease H1 N-terminal domain-containing protein n=1 Tax=Ephemerocybe angulata TaxID=980116 RepID=A0A8H5F7E1_9AGAR|nr:hypothetical protein D9611_000752 [Tulosesus angulatus]
MVNQSNVSQEGIATIGRVAVSPSLLRLLGSLIRAIDDRHLILDSFVPAENVEHDLSTCARCMGTGIVRVPIGVSDDEDDDFDQLFPPPSANDAAPSPVATTHPAPSTSVPAAVPATSVPAAAAVAGSTPAAAAVAGSTPAATVAGSTPVASIVPVPSNAPPAPAMPLEVPAPTAPIPGLHSLGPNVPVPAPQVAVYTANDCERYYTVTRGIRVGVFGDWMNTSPFVTGVPAASYTRHRTLLAAYEAYVKAFGRGFVTHA